MARILAVRFSALGDVAMTIAALNSFAATYKDDEITLLSRPFMATLTEGLPANVHFRPVKLDDYKGLGGLRRLSRELLAEGYDVLVDWHDVLRTKVIRFFFRKAGRKVSVIDKERKMRKALTRPHNKVKVQQTTSPQRYAIALAQAGFPVELKPYRMFGDKKADISDLTPLVGDKGTDNWVGIAPFAAHEGKIYPLPMMTEVINLLDNQQGVKIFLFGSGQKEKEWCEATEAAHQNVVSLVGKSNLRKELRLMTWMDVMLTMDSANMHLSALAGTRTISIWGATHPLAGFAGMPAEGSIVLQQDLKCRPCSIFGNKQCRFGDCRCMTGISPETVVQTVLTTIGKHHAKV